MSSGKGSRQRPGTGYAQGWDAVFGKKAEAPKFNLCACMGPNGDDPYCPCEMDRRGLVATDPWTPEKVAEPHRVLDEYAPESQGETTVKED